MLEIAIAAPHQKVATAAGNCVENKTNLIGFYCCLMLRILQIHSISQSRVGRRAREEIVEAEGLVSKWTFRPCQKFGVSPNLKQAVVWNIFFFFFTTSHGSIWKKAADH